MFFDLLRFKLSLNFINCSTGCLSVCSTGCQLLNWLGLLNWSCISASMFFLCFLPKDPKPLSLLSRTRNLCPNLLAYIWLIITFNTIGLNCNQVISNTYHESRNRLCFNLKTRPEVVNRCDSIIPSFHHSIIPSFPCSRVR